MLHFAKNHVLFVLIVAGWLVLSTMLAATDGWSDGFSRLGGLMTAVTIGLVGWSIYEQEKFLAKLHEKSIDDALHRASSGLKLVGERLAVWNDEEVATPKVVVSQEMQEEIRSAVHARTLSIQIQTVVLVLGTLQWAVGDWLVCSIRAGELSTCSS